MKLLTERFRKSKFERFVRSYGVDELAVKLEIQPSAIYHWLRGSTAPKPVHAEIIQRLARQSGARLSMDSIYAHFLSLRADRAAEDLSETFLEASADVRILAG
jgi:hypothetical protein